MSEVGQSATQSADDDQTATNPKLPKDSKDDSSTAGVTVDNCTAEKHSAVMESSLTSWLPSSSWIQAAKDKTLSTLESVKKDLDEFSGTVQHEAANIATATVTTVKQQAELIHKFVADPHSVFPDDVSSTAATGTEQFGSSVEAGHAGTKEVEKTEEAGAGDRGSAYLGTGWMKSIVQAVQKIGGVEDTTREEENYTEEVRVGASRNTNLDQIQNDERTYADAPQQDIELYREWLKSFKIGEHNGEINMLLGYNPRLREIYSKTREPHIAVMASSDNYPFAIHQVPSKVSSHTFWNRYFFKVHIREMDRELADNRSKAKSELISERDETWSMCSNGANSVSSNNDVLQDVNDEDVEAEDAAGDPRTGAATPRQAAEDEQALSDEWEKFETKTE